MAVVVAVNEFATDTDAEIDLVKAKAAAHEKVGALMATTQEAKVRVDGTGADIDKRQREARELQKKEASLGEKLGEMEGDEIRVTRLKDEVRACLGQPSPEPQASLQPSP